jgi:hypothetical protein
MRFFRRLSAVNARSAWAAMALALALGSGCGKKAPLGDVGHAKPPVPSPKVRSPEDIEATFGLPSSLVARAPIHTLGPFWVRDDQRGMVVQIASRDTERVVVAVPTGKGFEPLQEPEILATVPAETTALVVRRLGPPTATTLALYTANAGKGTELWSLAISPQGKAGAPPESIVRTLDNILWMDVIPTPQGGLTFWAEENAGGTVNLFAQPTDASGKSKRVAVRVARSVSAWGIFSFRGKPRVVYVDHRGETFVMHALALDGDGQITGEQTRKIPELREGGIEIAVREVGDVADHVSVGWTATVEDEPQVAVATIGADNAIGAVEFPLADYSGSELVGVASTVGATLLAWKEPSSPLARSGRVNFARYQRGKMASPSVSIDFAPGAKPELGSDGTGFAVLGVGRACGPLARARGGCAALPQSPMFLRIDESLRVTETRPITFLGSRERAAVAWGLSCQTECAALAAPGESPAGVRTVHLERKATPFDAPLAGTPGGGGLVRLKTVTTGLRAYDLSTTKVGATTFVAYLADPMPQDTPEAPTRRKGARRRTRVSPTRVDVQLSGVYLLRLDGRDRPVGAPVELSNRALAVGQIAVAPFGDDGAVTAWVSRDVGDAQVHLSHVDGRGRRKKEVALTVAKGDAADATLTAVPGGYLAAWVDYRDGNGEVYATKVDRELERVGKERRLTQAPGDASDLVAMAVGDEVVLAWSDSRESANEGLGDIYVAKVSASDGSLVAGPVRVLASASHSRSPTMARCGRGMALSWIEDGLGAPDGSQSRAMVASLDSVLRPTRDPVRWDMADSFQSSLTAVDLTASGTEVRAVVLRSLEAETRAESATWSCDGAPPKTTRALFAVEVAPGAQVPFSVLGNRVFVADEAPSTPIQRLRVGAIAD